jgi:hypothetical protein
MYADRLKKGGDNMRTERILYAIIEVIFDGIAILLGLRVVFRFFGANSGTPFISWLYDTTGQLIAPFAGIFPNPRIEGIFLVDISAIVALVVYSVIGYVVLNFLADLRMRAAAREKGK